MKPRANCLHVLWWAAQATCIAGFMHSGLRAVAHCQRGTGCRPQAATPSHLKPACPMGIQLSRAQSLSYNTWHCRPIFKHGAVKFHLQQWKVPINVISFDRHRPVGHVNGPLCMSILYHYICNKCLLLQSPISLSLSSLSPDSDADVSSK